ncbi:MAG TPA: DUF2007 domain-containing protein [Bryobacteraceae bacterium]|nr:DUF2007 domain-containing protein [Bryobacteraceae bacterium]
MATVFQSSGFNAEVEAELISGVLESNGVKAVVSGVDTLPGAHDVLVQVSAEDEQRAQALIAEAQQSGPAAAEEGEKATEPL